MTGIDEEDVANSFFMKKISECTKMEPDEKVNKINKFIELYQDNTENQLTDEKWSSKKKSEYYGIQVMQVKDLFPAYYMTKTNLIDGKNKEFNDKNKEIDLVKKDDIIKWLLFCDESENENAIFLKEGLQKASGKYHIKINNPKLVKMKKSKS